LLPKNIHANLLEPFLDFLTYGSSKIRFIMQNDILLLIKISKNTDLNMSFRNYQVKEGETKWAAAERDVGTTD
jgi:hypothetical protein